MTYYMMHCMRDSRVKFFRGRNKLYMVFLKYLHHVCKIQNGTADTVEFVDNNTLYLACANIIHHFFKAGTVGILARKSSVCIFNAGFPVGFVFANQRPRYEWKVFSWKKVFP